jgi:hypothetical protein
VPHVDGLDSRSGTVAPFTASTKSIRTSVSTSAPRLGRAAEPVPPPRLPNRLPSRSLIPPPPAAAPPGCCPLNKSPKSNVDPPPPPPKPPPKPPGRNPPEPKSRRASSYCLRFSASPSTP